MSILWLPPLEPLRKDRDRNRYEPARPELRLRWGSWLVLGLALGWLLKGLAR